MTYREEMCDLRFGSIFKMTFKLSLSLPQTLTEIHDKSFSYREPLVIRGIILYRETREYRIKKKVLWLTAPKGVTSVN